MAGTFASRLDLLRSAGVEIVVRDGTPYLCGPARPRFQPREPAQPDRLSEFAEARALLADLRRAGVAFRVSTDERGLHAIRADGLSPGLRRRLEALRQPIIDLTITEESAL
jgi:hypothetical protein